MSSESQKWSTGRTCDAELEFRRDEKRPMSTLCDGVGQTFFVVGVVVGLGPDMAGKRSVETKWP